MAESTAAAKAAAKKRAPKSRKITDGRAVIAFRGEEFEVSTDAFNRPKFYALINDPATLSQGAEMLCLGHYVDYLERMPDEEGEADPVNGASIETLRAFIDECAGFAGKNS